MSQDRYVGIAMATRVSVELTGYEGPLLEGLFIAPRYNALLLPTAGLGFHPARVVDYTDRWADNCPHSDYHGAYWISGFLHGIPRPRRPLWATPLRRSALRGQFVWAETPESADF